MNGLLKAATLTAITACSTGPTSNELAGVRTVLEPGDCTKNTVEQLANMFRNSCDMLGEETAGGPNPKRVDMDAIVEVRNKDCDDLLRAEGTEWVCRSYVNDCFLDSSCHPVITDPAIIRTSFK